MKEKTLLQTGYKAQNGYVFTAHDCERYNSIQADINRFVKAGMPLRDGMLDHSCIMFKTITGMN